MRTPYRRFTQGAVEWRTYFADGDDPELKPSKEGDEPCEGSTCAGENTIVLLRGMPPDERASALVHELVHAAFRSSGISHSLRISMPREEQIAHAIAPYLAQALISGGFWKNPRGEE